MRTYTFLLLALLFSPLAVSAQEIAGNWITVDDNSGKDRSVVHIWKDQGSGKYFAKIEKILYSPTGDLNPNCKKCDPQDARYMKPVNGMIILRDLTWDGSAYSGGFILDPENGKEYRCKMWMEGNVLKVRGYLGPFYRTQGWKKG
jgi:uncharacterized protein (DUF2147 family)